VTALTAEQTGGHNVTAFLDMIAVSEGTDNGWQPTKNHGYDVLVGGGLLTSYADHPRKLVSLPRYNIKSSAAGRYQFLRATWDGLAKLLKLPDFSPESQDLACIQLLRQRHAYTLVRAGDFDEAVIACSKEWASLPGAGYGQHEQRIERLRAAYVAAGGTLAT
jgi:muramidase (phage lysozyme)